MALFPKVGDIKADLSHKFDQLIAKLDEILEELRRQRPRQ